MSTSKKPLKYPEICCILRANHVPEGPLSVAEAMDLIGWIEEPVGEKWGSDFALKDLHNKKIRLLNNTTNRPFKRSLADRYSNEHLRGKWSLNLETIVLSSKGNVLQGQHRFVGFILAEMARKLDPVRWGTNPLTFEVLLGFGVSDNPSNANTYDLGTKRSLGDVMYRHQEFRRSLSNKEQKRISAILSIAIRLVWLRAGGKTVSFAPHFPHTEAIEFYEKHPEILRAVMHICELEEGNKKLISSLISLGYASAFLYLMSTTDHRWDKAVQFWGSFASGESLKKGDSILSLRASLIKTDASSGSKRDKIISMVVKAWNLWIDDDSDPSRIGGLDSEVEAPINLTQHQLLILEALRKSKKEIKYATINKLTGLQTGQISKATMDKTKRGNTNPHSLVSRSLVSVEKYEPQEGEKQPPYWFRLTKKGREFSK